MAVTDFLVASNSETPRIHRATCKKLPLGTTTSLETFIEHGKREVVEAAVPASCCKPKAALVYITDALALEDEIEEQNQTTWADEQRERDAELVDHDVQVERETTDQGVATHEAEAPVADDTFGELPLAGGPVEEAPAKGKAPKASKAVKVKVTHSGPTSVATYGGLSHLWPAAKRGVEILFEGTDTLYQIDTAGRKVTLTEKGDGSETAELLEALWLDATAAVKEWRKTLEAKDLQGTARFRTAARNAAELALVIDVMRAAR